MERELQIGVAGEHQSAVELGSEIAGRRFGAIARRHLIAAGIPPTLIRSWLATDRLHPRYPGVYAWGRDELGTEGELAAALLLGGEGSALHSLTALGRTCSIAAPIPSTSLPPTAA